MSYYDDTRNMQKSCSNWTLRSIRLSGPSASLSVPYCIVSDKDTYHIPPSTSGYDISKVETRLRIALVQVINCAVDFMCDNGGYYSLLHTN